MNRVSRLGVSFSIESCHDHMVIFHPLGNINLIFIKEFLSYSEFLNFKFYL